MKTLVLFLLLLPAHASDFRMYSNGMACFQDSSGFTYGCSGGEMRQGETVMDIDSGRFIQQIGRDTAWDINTGRFLLTPGMPYRDDDDYQNEE